LVIIVFTNVDDLVSTNIEETTSQISKSLGEATSEVEFSNPLQTYEIDSDCELAYIIRDNIENNGSPLKVDQEYVENVLMAEFEKKSKKMLEKYGDQLRNPEFLKQKNIEFFDAMEQELIDYAMDYNSIHPKLRESVEFVLSTKVYDAETHQERITVLNIMYLIEPEPYRDDPQCGKKFHERFGDETFKALKQMFGEERAVSEYNNLKKIIYEN